jgi:hypothetical protein
MIVIPLTKRSVRVSHMGQTKIFISASFATLVQWAMNVQREVLSNPQSYGNK